MKGLFISFEGVEGTGKSTQARMLHERLGAEGMDVILTMEPGGTELGQKIREMLLSTEHGGMSPVTELMLYAASRSQHVSEVIAPALARGAIVLCDRFTDSTLAYQGRARGLDYQLIRSLNDAATGGIRPGLTVLMDIEVSAGLQRNRKANKVDRLELETVEFHEKVRAGFLAVHRAEPERVKLVDATGDEDEVHERVLAVVRPFLESRA